MAETDPLWRRASADLTIVAEPGVRDCFVWEHSVRVARTAVRLIPLPELAGAKVDRPALRAAALYHEAGWVIQYNERQIDRWSLITKPTNDVQRELAAGFLEQRAADLLAPRSLEAACTAVRTANTKLCETIESQLLSEAENLDQIGPLALWQMVRRHMGDGKGIEDAAKAWQRQQEYHFWQARIKDGFRFESVRQLARRRLASLEAFLTSISAQQAGEDLDELLEAAPRPLREPTNAERPE